MQEILRKHIEQVVTINDDEFEFIMSHFTFKKFKKNQFLVQEGENVKYNYFIVSGLLKLTYTEESGKKHIVAFAMEDWWESDFNAYYTRTKATMSLECVEDVEVFCLNIDDYFSLCDGLNKMERFFLEKANFGYISLQRRIISWLTSDTQERYYYLLKQYPTLVQRVPKSLLASYLGVSRETLSRLNS